ncbi:MAG: SDR family NAD(P)-dependent oxidoreductase [Polyangiaceae bacterium]
MSNCVVVGVGPGLGSAIARRFARGGLTIGLVARSAKSTDPVAKAIVDAGGTAAAAHADVTDEAALTAAIHSFTPTFGPADVLVYNASTFMMKPFLDATVADFESGFRTSCLGAVIAAKAVLPKMLERGSGTLLFTGATAGVRGSAKFAPFAAGKFALRAVVQSIAREFGPRGIHAAHVVVDGAVESDFARQYGATTMLAPDDVAEAYFDLHEQRRTAWTQELDLRPFNEKF